MSLILAAPARTDRARTADRFPLLAATAIRAAAARRPEHVAVRELDRHGEIRRETSYRALVERIHRVGQAALGALGLARGDNAAVLAPKLWGIEDGVCGGR